MLVVLVIGPESSGGRFLSRQLSRHPDIRCHHWSSPHGPRRGDRFWPTVRIAGRHFDRVVVTVRGWHLMIRSQVANHVPEGTEEAERLTKESLWRILDWLRQTEFDWCLFPYEGMVLHPEETMKQLFVWLGVSPIEINEEILDGNRKWHEG